MQIQFLGGAQTVTGSQHLLTINGKRLLLECGLFQGRRSDTYEKNLNFAYDPADVDAMVLSHAHIDHCGNIPNLYKRGYRNSIFATNATTDLCQLMLRDSAYLGEKDVEWINKKRRAKHEELIEPLYTLADALEAMNLFVGMQYNCPFEVLPGVKVTLQDAGHVLGSASVLLDIEEAGRKIRVGFSGDVGKRCVPILRDPDPPKDLDVLIMESTYGDREHPDDADCEKELADVVNSVYKRGGKLIIPAFAVGRTQVILYKLHLLQERNEIPKVPIYVDSPMACKAMDIFRSHPECFDEEMYEHMMTDEHDPLAPKGFACIRAVDQSKAINDLNEPMIIISASGMMEGGRVLHHLRNNIGNPKTMILFVGFAAGHTLARRIMDGEKKVRIFGEPHVVKAETRTMPYFSAHADKHGLMDFLSVTPPDRLKNVFLVHGEKSQAFVLKETIEAKGYGTVRVPAQGDSFEV